MAQRSADSEKRETGTEPVGEGVELTRKRSHAEESEGPEPMPRSTEESLETHQSEIMQESAERIDTRACDSSAKRARRQSETLDAEVTK